MAKPKAHEGREAFLEEAGQLYDRMIQRAGGSDTFDDMEEQGEAAGRAMILKMLRDRLAAELKAQTATVLCPKCRRPMRLGKKPAGWSVQTLCGAVPYERHHATCDRCGASFSPSGPAAEDPAARGIGPAPAKGLRGQRRRVV